MLARLLELALAVLLLRVCLGNGVHRLEEARLKVLLGHVLPKGLGLFFIFFLFIYALLNTFHQEPVAHLSHSLSTVLLLLRVLFGLQVSLDVSLLGGTCATLLLFGKLLLVDLNAFLFEVFGTL